MKIFFGTGIHERPLALSGELVRLDWETGNVEARAWMVSGPSSPADNCQVLPAGCRGVQALEDEVVAASYDALLFFGHDLVLRRRVTHRLMVDLHEIHAATPHRILVTSTPIDGVFEYEAASGDLLRAFWPREVPEFQERWHLAPMRIDKAADHRGRPSRGTAPRWSRLLRRVADRLPRRWWPSQAAGRRSDDTHVNAVSVWRGHVLALLSSFGAVVDLESREVLIEDRRLRGGHNLLLLPDERTIVANDTRGGTVRFYDLPSRRLARVIELRSHTWIRDLERRALARIGRLRGTSRRVEGVWNQFVRPLQVRGLVADDAHVWVGMSPAAIACFQVASGRFADGFMYTDDLRHRVNSLTIARS